METFEAFGPNDSEVTGALIEQLGMWDVWSITQSQAYGLAWSDDVLDDDRLSAHFLLAITGVWSQRGCDILPNYREQLVEARGCTSGIVRDAIDMRIGILDEATACLHRLLMKHGWPLSPPQGTSCGRAVPAFA